MLFAARFIQAFGASVGSVLGIAIARDVVKPAERGKMFSTIAIATAFSPAIGPVIGSFVIKFSLVSRISCTNRNSNIHYGVNIS